MGITTCRAGDSDAGAAQARESEAVVDYGVEYVPDSIAIIRDKV